MNRVLVTGATGFIGGHVARALLERGYRVRALLRPGQELPWSHPALGAAFGDIRDRPSVAAALQGCDAVVHVAGLYTFWAPKPKLMYQVNVEGTRNVLEAAFEAGVERIVHTSTAGTLKHRGGGTLADETEDAEPADLAGHYWRSKFQAELQARRLAGQGAPVMVVNPTVAVGPGDVKPTPTGQVIVDFLRGAIPAYVNTGLNLVDVADVAEGHVLALERGEVGQRYLLGNQEGNITLKEMLRMLAELTGRPAPRRRLPMALALAAAYVDQFVEGTLLRRQPRIPLEGTQHARVPTWVDCSKAVRELGLPQRPVRDALRHAIEWFSAEGYITPSRKRARVQEG